MCHSTLARVFKKQKPNTHQSTDFSCLLYLIRRYVIPATGASSNYIRINKQRDWLMGLHRGGSLLVATHLPTAHRHCMGKLV